MSHNLVKCIGVDLDKLLVYMYGTGNMELCNVARWICKPDCPCPSFHPITQGVQLFSLLYVRPRLSEVCLLRLRSIAFGNKVFSSSHAATGKRLAVFSPFFERSILFVIGNSSVWSYKSIMLYIWLVDVRNLKKWLTSSFLYLSKFIEDFTLCLNSFIIFLLWMIHWHM